MEVEEDTIDPRPGLTVLRPAALDKFAPPSDAHSLAGALVAGQLSPRTRKAYASDLAELLSVLDTWGLGLPEVNRDYLHAYRSWLAGEVVVGLQQKARPCAPATVSRKVSVVRRFFAEAHDRGIIPANPATRLRGFSISDESKTLGLTHDQARGLLGRIDTTALIGLRDRAMLSLMIRTGLRRMDVIGATLGNLRKPKGHWVLNIKRSKGNKDRTIKLPVQLWRDLDAWREAAREWRTERPDGSTPLFCAVVKSGRGKDALYKVAGEGAGQSPLSEKAIWKIVVKRAALAGIGENITPHSTRHTFITLALDGGVSLHKMQAAVGHANPRTTERYRRTKLNLDDNAVDDVKL